MLDKKNFDGAKQPLADVEAGWAHDPALKEKIGRAMASILVAEVLYHDRLREYAKVKQAARKLRADYKGLYREEDVFVPYAQALRLTGDWIPMGNVFNDDWTWEGKAKGAEAPVVMKPASSGASGSSPKNRSSCPPSRPAVPAERWSS